MSERDEIVRLAAEIRRKFALIAAARKRHGVKGGEPLLGLHLPESKQESR